jgi:hypothetical protein
MKSILLSVLIALAGGVLFGQDYFVVGKKTTYCSNLAYTTTAQGYLKTMTYVTEEGKTVSLQGRDNVPDVTTFFINGEYFDKVPLNANKPDKYIRYDKREINGKLIVYLERQGYIEGSRYGGAPGMPSGPSGTYRFFIRMPSGVVYKINDKKNMQEIFKPFFLKCPEFANEYKGEFTSDEPTFMNMVRLYNSLCE